MRTWQWPLTNPRYSHLVFRLSKLREELTLAQIALTRRSCSVVRSFASARRCYGIRAVLIDPERYSSLQDGETGAPHNSQVNRRQTRCQREVLRCGDKSSALLRTFLF